MSYKSILLVTICIPSLATASSASLEISEYDKEDYTTQHRKPIIFLDEYEDNSLSDENNGTQKPEKLKFDSLKSLYDYSNGKLNRRSNVNIVINLGNGSDTSVANETGETWGLVYPSFKKKDNQISRGVIITFLISHQLRENLLYLFGCLLQRTSEFLTEPQYTALYNLFIEIRNRPSRIHALLPDLKNVSSTNLNNQVKNIMQMFEQVLPAYVACAAKFWVQEIEENKINFEQLHSSSCSADFNILQDINLNGMEFPSITTPNDGPSKMAKYALGEFFVQILQDIQNLKISLSQAMFGIILNSFPIIPYDPVLEEYIRYIFNITIAGKIPSWEEIELQQVTGDPYRFIKTVIANILILSNVPQSIKEALVYIRIHLKPIPVTHTNPDFMVMHKINVNKFDIQTLLSFIVPEVFSKETICLKNRFLKLVQKKTLPQSWQLTEIDRLRYTNPEDLLFAYFTKLQKHIPDEKTELANTVTALLSVLMIDKQNKQFTPMTKNEEFLALFGYLANPEFGPQVNSIYHKFMNVLLSNPELQFTLAKIIPGKRGKCAIIDDCLKETIQNLENLNLDIPRRMEKIIAELNRIIPVQAIDPKCKTVCSNDTSKNIVTQPPNVIFEGFHYNGFNQNPYDESDKLPRFHNHDFGPYYNPIQNYGFGSGFNPAFNFRPQPVSGPEPIFGFHPNNRPNPNFDPFSNPSPNFNFGNNPNFGQNPNFGNNPKFGHNPNFGHSTNFNRNPDFGLSPDFGNTENLKNPFPSSANEYSSSGQNHDLDINQAKVVNVLMLPPMMQPTQQLTIYINNNGIPVMDNSNIPRYPGNAKVTLPSVLHVLNVPEINDPFGSMNQEFKDHILTPLIKISGSKDLSPILESGVTNVINSGKCPTLASLLVLLLEQAKTSPLVREDQHLLTYIRTYLSGLDLLAILVFPVVLKVANLYPQNGILYSIISISEPHKSSISLYAPTYIPEGMLVFAIVDPNILREPVNTQNPFDDLLPNVDPNMPGGNHVQLLKAFFTKIKIDQLFPNFKPEEYTSKGFLLMVILQKLPKVPEISADPRLKKIVLGYIWAFLIPAFFTKVPYSNVLAALGNQPRVRPETASLINLLPRPQNQKETLFFNSMIQLLERDNLFDLLLIPKPTPYTNQQELLEMITTGVVNSAGKFDPKTEEAAQFYNKKITDTKKGSLPLTWELENHEVTKFKVQLDDLLGNVINYESLSDEDKNAYNSLIEYFKGNSKIFSLMQEFNFKKYKTEGSFIKGLFEFFLKSQIITQSAKDYVQVLLPHVKLNGSGAKKLKMDKNGKTGGGRRSGGRLEIEI